MVLSTNPIGSGFRSNAPRGTNDVKCQWKPSVYGCCHAHAAQVPSLRHLGYYGGILTAVDIETYTVVATRTTCGLQRSVTGPGLAIPHVSRVRCFQEGYLFLNM